MYIPRFYLWPNTTIHPSLRLTVRSLEMARPGQALCVQIMTCLSAPPEANLSRSLCLRVLWVKCMSENMGFTLGFTIGFTIGFTMIYIPPQILPRQIVNFE